MSAAKKSRAKAKPAKVSRAVAARYYGLDSEATKAAEDESLGPLSFVSFAFPASQMPSKKDSVSLRVTLSKAELASLKEWATARSLTTEQMARVALTSYQSMLDRVDEATKAFGAEESEAARLRRVLVYVGNDLICESRHPGGWGQQ